MRAAAERSGNAWLAESGAMETVAYRSFVVRIWSRQGHAARALLEEMQTGFRSELRGEGADRLAAALDGALAEVARPPRDMGASGRTPGDVHGRQEE